MAAIFFGPMVLRPMVPLVAGLRAPSSTHPTVGRPVTTGTATPLPPSGTRRTNCWTTEARAARSKMGADRAGGRKTELKSDSLVGAVIAMVPPGNANEPPRRAARCGLGCPGGRHYLMPNDPLTIARSGSDPSGTV